jgi:uncharacterized protein (TIGR02452 family)
VIGRCGYGCENIDSFSLARKRIIQTKHMVTKERREEILVLNFANPIHPGGGVRRGARAQEEDLCRSSNLLYALEAESAMEYYRRNKKYNFLGSNHSILTKNVSIIRNTNGKLLDKPVLVDVLTIAAPMLPIMYDTNNGMYQEAIMKRIKAILYIAEYYGYRNLVLGAFGCGAFHNEPHDIASCFDYQLKTNDFNFESVYFVIKDDSIRGKENFDTFERILTGERV